MNYQETLDFLFSQLPVFEHVGSDAYKPGLERVEEMDNYFGNPHKSFKTIHVAGTNGKGSVSHSLASILQSAGYKVGLFTSPHLLDFNERIRVNGVPVPHSYVIDWTEKHYKNIQHIKPSFFELATMMGFCYFCEEQVDVAIIEVGLGGRLDSTNIITPVLSIITNISLDHTNLLGNTLPEIAHEKAGIIKAGIPCVIGECTDPDVRKVFEDKAESVHAPITFADANPIVQKSVLGSDGYLYETTLYGQLTGELQGACQPKNANTILTAAAQLSSHFNIPKSAIHEGLLHVQELTGLMGRWQKLSDAPLIYCDTGHNEGCFQYISSQLRGLLKEGKKIISVFGMMKDKDVSTVLGLLPQDIEFIFTNADTPRSMKADELQSLALEHGLKGVSIPNAQEAMQKALEVYSHEDANATIIFIGGSNFIVSEALKYLSRISSADIGKFK